MSAAQETFKNRFGLIAALLGMAVGTGNIWRFPRVMAANGGGAFLIPWFLFLFLWSVPLLMVEFSVGQKLRKGVTSCFSALSGGRFTWMGGFVVFCTLAIMFYYSVVTGWCLHYFKASLSGEVLSANPKIFWDTFRGSPAQTIFYHGTALGLVAMIVACGVRRGIERVSRVMIPLLFIMLIFLAASAMTLPGRAEGLAFIFNTDFSKLLNHRVWLEGLSQSAWSTGAGWGLAMTYACYAQPTDHPVLTPMTTGFGNNAIELIVVFAIMPTLFTFLPLPELLELTASGNEGFTFIALPGLFMQIPAGRLVAILFFGGLFMAAFTSLVAMFELGINFFRDIGIPRRPAVAVLAIAAFLLGLPSAVYAGFFSNQDWVWGVGLIVSGFFFAVLVRRIGVDTFLTDYVSIRSAAGRRLTKLLLLWGIPIQFLCMIGWWFYQSTTWHAAGWWNPLEAASIGTCLAQWAVLLLILLVCNRKLTERLTR